MNENVYFINWKRLLLWLMPRPLRKIKLLQWLLSITQPIQNLHVLFIAYRNNVKYWQGINSQVCYLEKMLNDRYDAVQRRIYIGKPILHLPLYVYLKAEQKPLYIYKAVEAHPKYLYTKAETALGGADFFVMVPTGLTANFIEMNVLIEKNKLPAKEHAIVFI